MQQTMQEICYLKQSYKSYQFNVDNDCESSVACGGNLESELEIFDRESFIRCFIMGTSASGEGEY